MIKRKIKFRCLVLCITLIVMVVFYYMFYNINSEMVFTLNKVDSNKNIKIAVLDSGYNNMDNQNINIIKITPEDDGIDRLGHGSEIISIINNFTKNTKIYSLKVLDDSGNGNRSKILQAIDWCIENKINIVNLSFSMPNDDEDIKEKLKKLDLLGTIIICSHDNDGKSSYPAEYIFTFGVKAHNKFLRRKEVFIKENVILAYGGDKEENNGKYNSFATARVTAFFLQNTEKKI